MTERTIEKNTLLNSVNIAILFSANALTWILMLDNSIVAIIAMCVVLFVIANKRYFTPRVVVLIFFLLFCFLFSFLSTSGNTTLQKYFLEFLMFGCVALLMSQTTFDINTTITTLCILSIPVAPFISRIDLFNDTDYGQWMGISYGSIKFIIALFYSILFINYKKKWVKVLFSGALLYYIYLFLTIASRGAVLGVFVFFILVFLIKRNYGIKKSLIVVSITTFLIVVFFIPIIEYILSLFGGEGLDFYALEKIVSYSESGNLDNGRKIRIDDGLQMFYSSPVFGNGIAAFEQKYNMGYVHNLFVQQLLEGGIIMFLPLTIVLLYSMYWIFSNTKDSSIRIFVAYLFCCNVIGLLFSDYFWRNQGYWFLIGYMMLLSKSKKNVSN